MIIRPILLKPTPLKFAPTMNLAQERNHHGSHTHNRGQYPYQIPSAQSGNLKCCASPASVIEPQLKGIQKLKLVAAKLGDTKKKVGNPLML